VILSGAGFEKSVLAKLDGTKWKSTAHGGVASLSIL